MDHVWDKLAVVFKATKGGTELFGIRGRRYARERRTIVVTRLDAVRGNDVTEEFHVKGAEA